MREDKKNTGRSKDNQREKVHTLDYSLWGFPEPKEGEHIVTEWNSPIEQDWNRKEYPDLKLLDLENEDKITSLPDNAPDDSQTEANLGSVEADEREDSTLQK